MEQFGARVFQLDLFRMFFPVMTYNRIFQTMDPGDSEAVNGLNCLGVNFISCSDGAIFANSLGSTIHQGFLLTPLRFDVKLE